MKASNHIDFSMEPVIETTDTEVWFADHILYINVKPGAEIDLEAAKNHLGEWKNFLMLNHSMDNFAMIIDISGLKSITREARIYYTKEQELMAKSLAFLTASPLSKIIGNFFMSFGKSKAPMRIFSNNDDAIAWSKKNLDK